MIKRFILLVIACVFSLTLTAQALTPEQRRLMDSGILYYNLNPNEFCSTAAQISGEDALATVYNYLVGKQVAGEPLQDFMVAGILANMKHESGIQPMRLQNTASGVETPAESLTAAQRADPRLGWGLVQWTPVTKVIDPLSADGKNPNDIFAQLDFLLGQLNGETSSPETRAGEDLVSTTNVAEATVSFETKYERHAGPPQPARVTEGENILQLVQGSSVSTTSTANGPSNRSGIVVALDPGHGGEVTEYIDPETNLGDRETTNSPEREDAQDVAERVKVTLEDAGYTVVLLRETPTQVISKRDRVNAAVAAGADIAVSIHTDPGGANEVWPQFTGAFRENNPDAVESPPGGGEWPTARVEFTNEQVATESNRISEVMASERTTTEGHTVSKVQDQTGSFGQARGLPSFGNLSLVQLWSSNIPWVYNEIARDNGDAISDARKQAYADGIANGIKNANIGQATNTSTGDCGRPPGDLIGTTLDYAWPDYRSRGTPEALEMKPAYEEAVRRAQSEGRYVGGVDSDGNTPGIDCGGFVTTVMFDSGFDPTYNHNATGGPTGTQLQWARDNWTKIGEVQSTAELQPGDVAFEVNADGSNSGHTFMWVGEIPGFEYPIASSSLHHRAPMSGAENPLSSGSRHVEWYRKN